MLPIRVARIGNDTIGGTNLAYVLPDTMGYIIQGVIR